MAGGKLAAAATQLRSYQVLFYKRTNKVHKSRGVSKFDGKMTIAPSPSRVVKLAEDDSANDAKKPSLLYNKINDEVSRKAFGGEGLRMDDTVVLGQYEVQIVSVDGADLAPKPALTPTKRKTLSSLVSKRRLVSRETTTEKKQPPQKRIPPPQPAPKAPPVAEIESDESEDGGGKEAPNESTTTTKRVVAPFLLQNRTKKKVITRVARPVTTTSSCTPRSLFPGANGNMIIPPSIRKALRPHQTTGIAFLWNCLTGQSAQLQKAAREAGISQDKCKGVILADEMGLGKTLMTIATLFALHRRNKGHRFIVVCPSSLVSNWAKEFDKWLGRASQPKRVVVRKGGKEGAKLIRAFVQIKPNQSEVLIISYELFRMNSALLAGADLIELMVVDEGHRLKNSTGSQTLTALQSLKCEARLLITGTPIQNNLSEFFTVANYVCPGLLGDLNSFRKEFERAINAANNKGASWEQKCRGQAQSKALESITKTFMLRRLQKDVLKSILPPRQELLLFCRPSEEQCRLFRELTDKIIFGRVPSVGTAEALTELTKLRKLCCHPRLVDGQATTTGQNCQAELSGKLHVLDALLLAIKETGDKVVIVSNFTTALGVIEDTIIKPHGITFCRLDGSTELSSRQAMVDSFNRASSSQRFVFLLSSKSGGCGLNLVGANRLIMFDADFNPATDMQAMARVYRQGQTKPCYIYRLFTSGTVEEVIYQRQQQKGNLASITVDGESCAKKNSGFTKEELRDCFTLKLNCRCDTKNKMGNRWPDYDGSESLSSLGCNDQPLINVAASHSDVLPFIHLVSDAQEPPELPTEDGESISGASDEEEYEFEQSDHPPSDDSSDEEESETQSPPDKSEFDTQPSRRSSRRRPPPDNDSESESRPSKRPSREDSDEDEFKPTNHPPSDGDSSDENEFMG